MLSCIIIDDEEKDRQNLKLLLSTYCSQVEVVAEAWDKESIIEVLNKHKVDVVFMDIHLGKITCFDIIKDWSEDQLDFKIIFVTASEKHAIMGYQYDAIDYILKPIHSQRLIEVVNKVEKLTGTTGPKDVVIQEFNKLYEKLSPEKKVSVSDGKEIHVLTLQEILYCKSEGNYTTIVLENDRHIVISKKLKYFENHFVPMGFFRVHRSYLVNMLHIAAVSKKQGVYITMSDGMHVPVSKYCKDLLFEKMNII